MLFLYAAASWLWSTSRDTAIEHWVVHTLTVKPASGLINWFTPDVAAVAQDYSIRAAGGGINVLNGCEGIDLLILIVSALLVAPLAWRWRVAGIALSLPLVWLLNQGRLLSLFYANRIDKELFGVLHGTVAPLVLIAAVACLLIAFMALADRANDKAAIAQSGRPVR
jgi:exosortase/archaeosortase family protein